MEVNMNEEKIFEQATLKYLTKLKVLKSIVENCIENDISKEIGYEYILKIINE